MYNRVDVTLRSFLIHQNNLLTLSWRMARDCVPRSMHQIRECHQSNRLAISGSNSLSQQEVEKTGGWHKLPSPKKICMYVPTTPYLLRNKSYVHQNHCNSKYTYLNTYCNCWFCLRVNIVVTSTSLSKYHSRCAYS